MSINSINDLKDVVEISSVTRRLIEAIKENLDFVKLTDDQTLIFLGMIFSQAINSPSGASLAVKSAAILALLERFSIEELEEQLVEHGLL